MQNQNRMELILSRFISTFNRNFIATYIQYLYFQSFNIFFSYKNDFLSLPDKVINNNFVKLKMIRLGHFKENIIGFIDGRDAASKLTVMNVKTNQVN